MKECIKNRCADVSSTFDEGDEIINTSDWNSEKFFVTTNGKKAVTDIFEDSLSLLLEIGNVKNSLESMEVDIGNIIPEWKFLKSKMATWGPNKAFPPSDWSDIAGNVKLDNYSNLLSLVDFLLSHSLSSADAERAFSAMKQIKTSKRTQMGNKLLTLQLRMNIDGPSLSEFNPEPSINHWLIKPTIRNKSGVVKSKRPNFMNGKQPNTFGPKPKKTKAIEIFDD